MIIRYETPDEHLSYSELKDRIREECAKSLPKQERVLLMAKKLEDDLTLKDTICNQICADLEDVTSVRHIQRCLPAEYKQHKKKRDMKKSTSGLATMSPNNGKNVPEQRAMTVDTGGYEEAFDETKRRYV